MSVPHISLTVMVTIVASLLFGLGTSNAMRSEQTVLAHHPTDTAGGSREHQHSAIAPITCVAVKTGDRYVPPDMIYQSRVRTGSDPRRRPIVFPCRIPELAHSGEGIEKFGNAFPEAVDGSLGGLAEERFEFGEELLDRIEGRRIGRQVEPYCAASIASRTPGTL
jgi:hypothetical protein